MGNVGVIVFAFGQPGETYPVHAGPSNDKITKIASRIIRDEKKSNVFVAAQWETSTLDEADENQVLMVSQRNDPATHYIDTKGVLDKSLEYFTLHDVQRVVLVAHPLHLFFIKFLIKTKLWDTGDFVIDGRYDKLMKSVPYDRSEANIQNWTRGPIRFVSYLVRAFVTKRHGS